MESHFTHRNELPETLKSAGRFLIRYGLVILLVWVGALKFTAYEAENIKPLVAHSPLMSWGYKAMSVQGFSELIGCVEITLGLLIATRSLWPRVSALGSLGACAMFVITLSFVFSTPGVWQPGYGFPVASALPGQLLLKDVLLLGAALWTAGEALAHAPARSGMAVESTTRSIPAPIAGQATDKLSQAR